MTFKEILKEWWNGLKAFSTETWKAIRNLFSTSFQLIKEPVVTFLKALWAWIKAIVGGLYKILKSFLIDFITSTLKMLWRSFVCFCKWFVGLFKKSDKKDSKKKK